jgi:WD40 repeat protein
MHLALSFTALLALSEAGPQAKPPARLDPWGDPLPPGALFRTGTIRAPHRLTGVHFYPDGKLLADVGDGAVRLWDAVSGKEVRRLAGRERPVSTFVFSPDGKFLISGGQDGAVRRWEVASGKEVACFTGHKECVRHVALAADGSWIASWDSCDVRFWDVRSGRETRRVPGSGGNITLALSPDGTLLAAEDHDHPIRLWETATGKPLDNFKGTDSKLEYPHFLPDGKTLLTIGHGGGITWREVATGRKIRRVEKAGYPIAVSADGRLLATGKDHGWHLGKEVPILLWDLATGMQVRRLRGHQDGLSSLAFSPDGTTLASLGGDHTLRRWDLRSGEELGHPAGHQNAVTSVAFSPDGKLLASGSADRTVRLWDPLTGREKGCLRSEHEPVQGIAFLPGGDILLSRSDVLSGEEASGRSEDKDVTRVRLWDVASGRERRRFEVPTAFLYGMSFCRVSGTLALGGYDRIRLVDTAAGKELPPMRSDQHRIEYVAFSPDGRLLAATSDETGIRQTTRLSLYDATSGKERWQQWATFESFGDLAFSPDGKTLAVGGSNVRLWDAAGGEERGKLNGADGCVAFSPDGRTLATCSWPNGVLLWEVATGKQRRRFAGHGVSCLAFSPDGRLLATGGADTLVMVWDVTGRLTAGEAGKVPLEKLWARLADEDAAAAYEALWGLVFQPEPTLEFLRHRLPVPSEADGKRIDRLIAALDEDAFVVREKATADLAAVGLAAVPALRRCLEGKPSAEVRQRVEGLLEKVREPGDLATDPGLWQALRLVEVLEHISNAGAEEALNELAGRSTFSRVRQEARASLERLAKRAEKARG